MTLATMFYQVIIFYQIKIEIFLKAYKKTHTIYLRTINPIHYRKVDDGEEKKLRF